MKIPSKDFNRLHLPLLIYSAAIFIFSCFHEVPLPQVDRLSTDKIYHIIEYSALGYLILRSISLNKRRKINLCLYILTFFIGIFYGITDEIHQEFVPGRYFSYWDMVANGVGTLLGVWIFNKWGVEIEGALTKFKLKFIGGRKSR